MALKIEWGDESRTYIYSRFYPGWSWQDFRANRPQFEEMLASVQHRVDFVADFTDVSVVPTNMLANVKNIFDSRLENEGNTILVGAGKIVQLTYDMVAAVIPIVKDYVIFVSSMEDALEIVKKDRESQAITKS